MRENHDTNTPYNDSADFFNMRFKFVSYATNPIPSYMGRS